MDNDLNLDVITDVVAEQAANRPVGSGRFVMKDGEITRIRFNGGSNEPHRWDAHWVNRIRRMIPCASGMAGFPGCVCCNEKIRDNSIGNPNPRLSFTILVDRWVHIVETQDGNSTTRKWFTCKKNRKREGQCDICASGNEAVREGKRYWDMAPKHAQGLQESARKLGKECASCNGANRLELVGHICSNCGEPLSGIPEGARKVLCPGCNQETRPDEDLECGGKCENPKRRRITDCWMEVKRIGDGTSTMYSFDPERPSDLDGDDCLVEPFDFRNAKKPKDQGEIANMLGVPNPFGAPAGSSSDGTIFNQANRQS